MGFGWPENAKGVPFNTDNLSASTSGAFVYDKDSWIDFENKRIHLIYDTRPTSNRRAAESIVTYVQKEFPTNPEYGDIWINPSGSWYDATRIYRLPPIGWSRIYTGTHTPTAGGVPPPTGAPPPEPPPPSASYEAWIKVSGQDWITTTNFFDSQWLEDGVTGDYLIPANSNTNEDTYWSTVNVDGDSSSAAVYPNSV